MYVCVYVCVREREREKEGVRERERERDFLPFEERTMCLASESHLKIDV